MIFGPIKYSKEAITWWHMQTVTLWSTRISARNLLSHDFQLDIGFWSTFKLMKFSILVQFEQLKVDQNQNLEFDPLWIVRTVPISKIPTLWKWTKIEIRLIWSHVTLKSREFRRKRQWTKQKFGIRISKMLFPEFSISPSGSYGPKIIPPSGP